MNCIAIGSDRDVEHSPITVNNFNIVYKQKFSLNSVFEISDLNGKILYNCKFSSLGLNHDYKIINEDGKSIAKIDFEKNTNSKDFTLNIIPKNNNGKEENFSLTFKRNEFEENSRKYTIIFYNKAIENEDVFEVVDDSYVGTNNYLMVKYNIYHGSFNTEAPLVCHSDQSFGTTMTYSLDIQPGIEPVFMLILHFGILINNVIHNRMARNPFNN